MTLSCCVLLLETTFCPKFLDLAFEMEELIFCCIFMNTTFPKWKDTWRKSVTFSWRIWRNFSKICRFLSSGSFKQLRMSSIIDGKLLGKKSKMNWKEFDWMWIILKKFKIKFKKKRSLGWRRKILKANQNLHRLNLKPDEWSILKENNHSSLMLSKLFNKV